MMGKTSRRKRRTVVKASEIISFLGGAGNLPSDFVVSAVLPADQLRSGAVSFLSRPSKALIEKISNQSDILLLLPMGVDVDVDCAKCAVHNPRLAFARVLQEFFKPKQKFEISSHAIIDPSAKIGENVNIGHFSIIGPNVKIGDNTFVGSNVEIHENVVIGENCILKSQCVIGQDGYGFERDEANDHVRIPHIGSVVLKDHVEIGSCSTVAAGTLLPTIIGPYSKIDDHAHVGHNCKLGRNTVVTAGVVVSGSVTTEDDVWFGPNSSMMQSLHFEKKCTVGVGAVMFRDGLAGKAYAARPALPMPVLEKKKH